MDQDQVGEQPESGGKETKGTSSVFDPSSAWVVTPLLALVVTPLFPCNLVEMKMMVVV